MTNAARAEVSAFAEEEAQRRILELERMLARERANTGHQLGEQERRLAEERRDRALPFQPLADSPEIDRLRVKAPMPLAKHLLLTVAEQRP